MRKTHFYLRALWKMQLSRLPLRPRGEVLVKEEADWGTFPEHFWPLANLRVLRIESGNVTLEEMVGFMGEAGQKPGCHST